MRESADAVDPVIPVTRKEIKERRDALLQTFLLKYFFAAEWIHYIRTDVTEDMFMKLAFDKLAKLYKEWPLIDY